MILEIKKIRYPSIIEIITPDRKYPIQINVFDTLALFLSMIQVKHRIEEFSIEKCDGERFWIDSFIHKIEIDYYRDEADYSVQCHDTKSGTIFHICHAWFVEFYGSNIMEDEYFYIKINRLR